MHGISKAAKVTFMLPLKFYQEKETESKAEFVFRCALMYPCLGMQHFRVSLKLASCVNLIGDETSLASANTVIDICGTLDTNTACQISTVAVTAIFMICFVLLWLHHMTELLVRFKTFNESGSALFKYFSIP